MDIENVKKALYLITEYIEEMAKLQSTNYLLETALTEKREELYEANRREKDLVKSLELKDEDIRKLTQLLAKYA